MGLIRGYQVVLSPLLGGRCRFYPSCSSYWMTAIERHGCLRGAWLGIARLARCHPFHPGGVDPVPVAGLGPVSPGEAVMGPRGKGVHGR